MSGRYSTGRPDESRGPDYRAPDSGEESLSSSSDYDEEDEDELNSSMSYSIQQQHALFDRRADVDDVSLSDMCGVTCTESRVFLR